MVFKVKITKCSFIDIWYLQSIGKEFKVLEKQNDDEFYILVGENRVISKEDCYISDGAKRQEPIPEDPIQIRVIKDGYDNVSHALKTLGREGFRLKYKVR